MLYGTCNNFGLYSESLQSQVSFDWQLLSTDTQSNTPKDLPDGWTTLLSSLHVPFLIFLDVLSILSLSVPFLLSLFYSSLPLSFFPPFHPILNLFIFRLSTSPSLLSSPTVALLNKCISHMVELTIRSFSSAPYGPTVMLHKVFKVTALQQISVYCRDSSLLQCSGLIVGYYCRIQKKCLMLL